MIKTLLLVIPIFAFSCQNEINYEKKYPDRWIGDIEQDTSIDDVNFRVCNGDDNIIQYFNALKGPVYFGEKTSFVKAVRANYNPIFDKSQNGLIRIRFIVNCEGKAGRFRVLQADSNYRKTEFDEKIVSQLITITKEIEEWEILYKEGHEVDYYYYLIFRIVNGKITEILP